ncbi:MAG TPA: PilZ domain-containing protein [Candidatus Omnitrophota bacterium]|nr:PilZ domain-containing protein [Candidatus Omnitrophota bacterium]HPD84506.1 PilZ domain-containing protein [Candidatus Omnitrophota bacterium]HRZ03364.1 PilZ domain-containing protein [Candidatus Omnitrophota bacterium]
MKTERRKNPRFECPPSRDFLMEADGSHASAMMENFSRSGLGLESLKPLEDGAEYKFKIRLSEQAQDHALVPCEVRIVWVNAKDNQQGYVCGAQITHMAPSDKTDILDILYEDWKRKAVSV